MNINFDEALRDEVRRDTLSSGISEKCRSLDIVPIYDAEFSEDIRANDLVSFRALGPPEEARENSRSSFSGRRCCRRELSASLF